MCFCLNLIPYFVPTAKLAKIQLINKHSIGNGWDFKNNRGVMIPWISCAPTIGIKCIKSSVCHTSATEFPRAVFLLVEEVKERQRPLMFSPGTAFSL